MTIVTPIHWYVVKCHNCDFIRHGVYGLVEGQRVAQEHGNRERHTVGVREEKKK